MSPERFREVCKPLVLTYAALAFHLGCDDRLVRRWASGKVGVPADVAAWLEALVVVWETRPKASPEWYYRPEHDAYDS